MPTIKQKKAYSNLVENGGNVSKAMRDASYSIETAKTPSKLTNSVGFQELLKQKLPDKLLVKVHKEGLKATKLQGVGGMLIKLGNKGGIGHTDQEVPDYAVRHKYLETAYKIKGLQKEEKTVNTLQNIAVFIQQREQEPLHLEVDT